MMDLSRRMFVGALGAPALMLGQSPNDTIRVAFIGTGNRGSYLLRHTLKLPGVQVVAVCDIDPGNLKKAQDQAAAAGHKADTYSDFRQMLDDRKDIDAVVIATPVDVHKGTAIAALELGKHVYCEKPMAHTAEDVDVIHKASRSAKGILQLGFQLRHDPNRRAAVQFIHSGGLGKVLFLQGYRNTGDLPRNTLWYFDRTRSGDNIVEQACHILDLFVWVAGKPPLRAYGSGGINLYHDIPPARTTMDNYTVIYEFPDDIRCTFTHLYFDPPGFSGIHERVFGARGAVDLGSGAWQELDKRGEVKLEVPDAGEDSTKLSLAAFFDNARAKRPPLNNADSGRLSTLVAMMGRKAIYEKRVVSWEEMGA